MDHWLAAAERLSFSPVGIDYCREGMKLFHALGVSLFAFPFLLVEALAPPIQEPGYPDEKDDVDDEADGDEGVGCRWVRNDTVRTISVSFANE